MMTRHRSTTPVRRAFVCAAALLSAPLAHAAPQQPEKHNHAPPAYMDDRSTATSVVKSLYNAINRHEYARAYSYWGADAKKPDFKDFVAGYEKTRHIRLFTGTETSEGAAGSVYYAVPVSLRAVNTDGTTIVFAGCYTVRLANPANQAEPPFVPMHIEQSKILRARGRTSQAVPDSCDS